MESPALDDSSVSTPDHHSPQSAHAAPAPAPTGGYTDYILRSTSASSGWKYNVMKFATLADREISLEDMTAFHPPLRLNRKDPRTVRRLNDEDIERYSKLDVPEGSEESKEPIMVNGKLIGADGKPIKEEMDETLVGRGLSGNAPINKKINAFKKRTKRVYVASEEARRLKREEWMPWVLEDKDANERWIGRLEGGTGEANQASAANRAAAQAADAAGTGNSGWRPTGATSEAGGGGSSYVAFVIGESGSDFNVVPAHRWYKFNQGPKYAMLGVDEAESEYLRLQKSRDPERWLMHRRLGTPVASTSTAAAAPMTSAGIKSEFSSATPELVDVPRAVQSSARARMLKKSQSLASATSEDKFGRSGRRFQTVVGGRNHTQGDDEFEYEADFQDDEEGIAKLDDLVDEDEQKDIEARVRKEFLAAKGFEEAEEVDEEAIKKLTLQGDEIKRLVKRNDKTGAYDSDEDEDNPYASEYDEVGSNSDDSIDAEVKAAKTLAEGTAASATKQHRSSSDRRHSSSRHRSAHRTGSTSQSRDESRSGSVQPSGSAHIARRATSPHAANRSPSSSRGNSPAANGSSKRRRAEAEADDGTKRRKAGSQSPPPAGPLLTDVDVIAFLKTGSGFTTKDLLLHFRKALKDARNKAAIGKLIHAVASLNEGILVLKPELA